MATKESSTSLTMTIPEFAKAANISPGLAYDLARKDDLPVKVIHFGRRMLLSRRAVDELLGTSTQNGALA